MQDTATFAGVKYSPKKLPITRKSKKKAAAIKKIVVVIFVQA
jgi:hypothetical protein